MNFSHRSIILLICICLWQLCSHANKVQYSLYAYLIGLSSLLESQTVMNKGLFNVHESNGHYYFEIPDSLLTREFLVVNRLSKASELTADLSMAAIGFGFRYDNVGENNCVISFDRAAADKIILLKKNYQPNSYIPDTTSRYKAISSSITQPIYHSFDIQILQGNSKKAVVDVTEYLRSENSLFSISAANRSAFKLAKQIPEKSYISSIRSYSSNIQITIVRTFEMAGGRLVSYEITSSVLLLPTMPMRPRYADQRVGYRTMNLKGFDDQGGNKISKVIERWRLEPKKEDVVKFRRGDIVEPVKPIIFYIDPNFPEKWKPYLFAAVKEWQPALERVGFKNAVYAKSAPTPSEDSTWSLNDLRNSGITYIASDRDATNAYNITDPRSGELIQSHIKFSTAILQIVHDEYLLMASPSDARARTVYFEDELMGRLIQAIITHEVGHALGLEHNDFGTYCIPVEKLRDKNWLAINNTTASIMDHARFNYVAQPGDSVPPSIPMVGDYDVWAIEWGYKHFFEKTTVEEKKLLNGMIKKSWANPRLRYLDGSLGGSDPRARAMDIGDNAITAGEYGIKNLQWILPRLKDWLEVPSEGVEHLDRLYRKLADQYLTYIDYVKMNIGGVYFTLKSSNESGPVYNPVPKSIQQASLKFLDRYFFHMPGWLINNDIRLILPETLNAWRNFDSKAFKPGLEGLVNFQTFQNLLFWQKLHKDNYAPEEYLLDLDRLIWNELDLRQEIDQYRCALQKEYVERMLELITSSVNMGSREIEALIKNYLIQLQDRIIKVLPQEKDPLSILHLEEVLKNLRKSVQS